MLGLTLALTLALAGSAPPDDTVLIRDVETASGTGGDSVLGWRKVPAATVTPDQGAVPNVYLDLLAADPDTEPLARDQWALPLLGATRAWRESTGHSGIVIAVIDSGIQMDHPELAGRLFSNPGETPGNGVDDDGNGLVDDVAGWDIVDNDNDPSDTSVGHGTEVAGVAVASLNGIGIAGLAPTATLLPIRACANRCELFAVAWAVKYATDLGADIINLSLGGFAEPGPLADAVDYAEAAGVLVVAAAGNTGSDIDGKSFVPADLPNRNLIAVAATDRDDRLWNESNHGVGSVEVGAPGVSIVTSTIEQLGSYRTVTGTSFAAPHVSATAALMLSANPGLRPPGLITRLGEFGAPLPDLSTKTTYGTRLQSDHAVLAALLRDIDDSVFAADIVWLAAADITKGCNPPHNDRFCPHHPVTRGEIAAFFHRALDLDPGPDAFTDDTNSIFEASINALAAADITKGCNPPHNDRFCPHDPVTRGEIAAFLRRALR